MSTQDLDSIINHNKPSKFGQRYDSKNDNFLKQLEKNSSDIYSHNTTDSRDEYVGVVLRVESLNSEGTWPYEPGSMSSKKYSGKTEANLPSLVAAKVRIPELHYMLPLPVQLGNVECSELTKENMTKCWQPIIDMYPTFYAETDKIPEPDPGDLVSVRYGDLENMQDPILMEGEIIKNFALLPGFVGGASGASFSGLPDIPSYQGTDKQLTEEQIRRGKALGITGPWGKITTKDGKYNYQITDRDVLWATKMVIGEGSDSALILWSMVALLVWHNQRRGRAFYGKSYFNLIYLYSQPISPRWRRTGDKCIVNAGKTFGCRTVALQRREIYRSMSYDDILADPVLKEKLDLVIDWAKGKVENPDKTSRTTDFAVASKSAVDEETTITAGGKCPPNRRDKNGKRKPCSFNHIVKKIGGVWYVSRPGTQKWGPGYIQITAP